MFEVTALTVFLFTFVLCCSLMHLFGTWQRRRSPPGPFGFPIVGHLPLMGESPIKAFAKWRKQYGDVFRIRLGSWETVVLNGYDAVREAAEQHDDAFSSRPNFTTQRLILECNGEVSLAFGPFSNEYLMHRKIIANVLRAFTGKGNIYTEELLQEEADILTTKLLKNEGPVDICYDIRYSVGSLIYQLLYGRGEDVAVDIKQMIKNGEQFNKFAKSGNSIDVMPWLEWFMPNTLDQFRNMIMVGKRARKVMFDRHIAEFTPDSPQRDIIDGLLAADIKQVDNHAIISRSRLLETVGDLQGAGFDTTTKTLQFLLLHMCKFPEVQTKVHRELDDVIGGGRNVMLKDRHRLVYIEATILESMRVATLVPFALPRYTTKDTQINGYNIAKDTVVFFNIHSTAHDPQLWEDPEVFRPERFLDGNNQLDMKKCAQVLSFSVGRRRCVGEHLAKMEIFVLFANVMQKCSFLKPDGEMLDMEPVQGLVYSPKPFKVIVKERV